MKPRATTQYPHANHSNATRELRNKHTQTTQEPREAHYLPLVRDSNRSASFVITSIASTTLSVARKYIIRFLRGVFVLKAETVMNTWSNSISLRSKEACRFLIGCSAFGGVLRLDRSNGKPNKYLCSKRASEIDRRQQKTDIKQTLSSKYQRRIARIDSKYS